MLPLSDRERASECWQPPALRQRWTGCEAGICLIHHSMQLTTETECHSSETWWLTRECQSGRGMEAVAPCSVRLAPQEGLCLMMSSDPGLMSSELILHYVTQPIGSPGNECKALPPRPGKTLSIFKMLEWHFCYFLFNGQEMKFGKQDICPGMRTWRGDCNCLLCLGVQLRAVCGLLLSGSLECNRHGGRKCGTL